MHKREENTGIVQAGKVALKELSEGEAEVTTQEKEDSVSQRKFAGSEAGLRSKGRQQNRQAAAGAEADQGAGIHH